MRYRFAGNVEETTLVDEIEEPKEKCIGDIVDIHKHKITINNVKLENIKRPDNNDTPGDDEYTAFRKINLMLSSAVFNPSITPSQVDSYVSNMNSEDTPVLIRLIYNKSMSFKEKYFYSDLLEKYGKLINSRFFDTKESDPIHPRNFGFFHLNYTKDHMLPSKFILTGPFEKSQLIIDVQIISKISFCQYCRSRSHKVQECPLRPLRFSNKCKYCQTNTNKHNYLSCSMVPVEDKLTAVSSLPHEIIQRSLNTANPFKQIPYEIIKNKDFPIGALTQMQRRKLIDEVEKRNQLEAFLDAYIASQNGEAPDLSLRPLPRYMVEVFGGDN